MVPEGFGGYQSNPAPLGTGALLPVINPTHTDNAKLDTWLETNVRQQKQTGYAAVTVRVEQGNLTSSTLSGSVPEGDYDDPTAVLAGVWGKNQRAKATVFSRNQTAKYFQEVEIRLRSEITPHRCTGYEVFWRCLKTEAGYAEIVRWNGPIGDFTSLQKLSGPQYGVENGDLVEAVVTGTSIKGFVNGVEVISATDDVFDAGNPGIGFNFGVGDTNVDHGFTYFEVDSYDD